MMVCREIPFAATLFHIRPALTQWVQDTHPIEHMSTPLWLAREAGLGCVTSAVASPISHVPSVIAAYQQGHGVDFRTALQQLLDGPGGMKELWRGLGARTFSLAGTFTVVPIVMELCKTSR